MRNKTNKCLYKYGSLFLYKQRSLLRISIAYRGHLQGGVLLRIYYIKRQNNLQIQNIIFHSCILLMLFLKLLTLILTCRPHSSIVCREFYLIFLCNIFSLGVLNSAICHNAFSHNNLLFHSFLCITSFTTSSIQKFMSFQCFVHFRLDPYNLPHI